MAALESVLEQALRLSEEDRSELVERLLRSLEPDDGEELTPEAWEAAWSAEIQRRLREVREGAVELVDGDEVLGEALQDLKSKRP